MDRASISVVDKEMLRNVLSTVQDRLKAWNKAISAARLNTACENAESIGTQAKTAGQKITVLQLEGIDGSIAKKIHEKLKGVHPDGSFLVCSMDESGDKINLFPLVCPAHVKAGLSAKAWNEHCFSIAGGGKGGGKPESAAGAAPGNQNLLDKIKEAAQSFGESKI